MPFSSFCCLNADIASRTLHVFSLFLDGHCTSSLFSCLVIESLSLLLCLCLVAIGNCRNGNITQSFISFQGIQGNKEQEITLESKARSLGIMTITFRSYIVLGCSKQFMQNLVIMENPVTLCLSLISFSFSL